MKKYRGIQSIHIFLIGAIVSILLRLSLIQFGYNQDFDSYLIVANLRHSGAGVYENTHRYNYGPIWFMILHLFYEISLKTSIDTFLMFRYMLVLFLSTVDICIGLLLWKNLDLTTAIIFLLNPISIIITGYHNQFDNFALLIGFISIIIIGNDFDKKLEGRKLFGLFMLGISLTTKHIFFMFPFWLAIKQKGFRQKMLCIIVPIIIFFVSFLPFWDTGHNGIIKNVFMYKSSINNNFFYELFIPGLFQFILSDTATWLLLLIIFPFILKDRDCLQLFLFYTCAVTAFSPSIVNQYLTIPMIFLAKQRNFLSLLYMLFGTIHLMKDQFGLHIEWLQANIPLFGREFYTILVILLVCSFVWAIWQEKIMMMFKAMICEIKLQLYSVEKIK